MLVKLHEMIPVSTSLSSLSTDSLETYPLDQSPFIEKGSPANDYKSVHFEDASAVWNSPDTFIRALFVCADVVFSSQISPSAVEQELCNETYHVSPSEETILHHMCRARGPVFQTISTEKEAFCLTHLDSYMRLVLRGVCQFYGLPSTTSIQNGQRCVQVHTSSKYTLEPKSIKDTLTYFLYHNDQVQ